MKLNIELGDKQSSPCACTSPQKDRVYYPELYINHDSPLDIPKEGTMVIRYKKVASSEREDNYTCTIEVHKLVSVEGEDDVETPSKRDKSAEEALDSIVAAKKKEKGY